MIKKAVSLLAALAMASSFVMPACAELSEQTAVVSETEEISQEQAKAESFALENMDPAMGKYLDTQQRAEAMDEERYSAAPIQEGAAYGGSDVMMLGYSNDALVHNPRYSNMQKQWGIDVSYFQYDIDWKKVKADGIDFAIIRLGYRGYGSAGDLVLDYKFKQNINNAIDAGVDVGVYFYTQAINTTEAVAEADFCLKYLKGYDLQLPVYFDIESVDYDAGRLDTAGLSKAQKTNLCIAFCDRIIENGYSAGVYANKYWLTWMIDGEKLEKKYPIWLAHYVNQTDYQGYYDIWQFASTARINGINTAVDVNVAYVDGTLDKIEDLKISAEGVSGTLSWTAVRNADKYEVYKFNTSTGKYARIAVTTDTHYDSIKITDTLTGYCVKPVAVINGKDISGEYSNMVTVSLGKANNFKAELNGNSVSLTWDEVSGAAGYEIYKKIPNLTSFVRCTTTTEPAFTFAGLEYGTYDEYKIRPYFVDEEDVKTFGLYTDIASVLVPPKKPAVPKHDSSTADTITVSFTAADGATGYEVAVYDSSIKGYKVLKTIENGKLSAMLTGFAPASSNKIAVRGFVKHGDLIAYSDYSSYKTCGTAAAAPTSPYATNTNTSVKMTWDAVNGADSYVVYSLSGNAYTELGTTDTNSFTFTETSKRAGRTYVVAAVNTINKKTFTSAYSAACLFTKLSPSKVEMTTFTATKSAVRINWKAVSGADGYRVYQYNPETKKYVNIKTISGGTTATYRIPSLDSATEYKYKVKAFKRGTNCIEWGPASDVFTAVTKG